jgi:predicted dehydrogenase
VSGRFGIAILGAAHMPHAWAYARAATRSDSIRLVGVHDRDPAMAQWIRQDFSTPFFPDAEALVSSPDVQGVIVCSETVAHREYVELAAAFGRHVLCEKPLATTLTDATALVETCRRDGVILQTAFPSRFQPMIVRGRQAVASGRLGTIVAMVGGNRGRPPLPPGYPPWITTEAAAGGGALIDHSVHVTDAMRHVSGLEVDTVSAECGALLWDCGVDDVAILTLAFDGGAVGSVDPSWSVPADNPWDYDFFLRLLGTEGSLELRDGADTLQLVSAAGPPGLRLEPFGEDVDLAMIRAFADSATSGVVPDPCATGEDGLRALEIALAGYTSARTHVAVTLPLPD